MPLVATRFATRGWSLTPGTHYTLSERSADLAAGEANRKTARAAELLDRVGLADRRDFLASKLSGGQKQRVAVARALMNQASPTGSSSSASAVAVRRGVGQAGGRGDQLVRLMVDLPPDDHELAKLVEAWTDARAVRADLGV